MAKTTHCVRYRDTLETISTAYYGTPDFADLIFQHNSMIIENPNQLNVGQTIVIPHVPWLQRIMAE